MGDNTDALPTDPTASAQVIFPLAITETGPWEVFARWTASSNRSTQAIYTIAHALGESSVTVNQRVDGGDWRSLGTFELTAGGNHEVRLTNALDGFVVADATGLVPTLTCSAPVRLHDS